MAAKIVFCNMLVLFFSITFITLISFTYSEDQLICPNKTQCTPLTKCTAGHNKNNKKREVLISYCHAGLNMVCCPLSNKSEDTKFSIQNHKTSSLPIECGATATMNKISGGKTADIGQFPWMALLGYKKRFEDEILFTCGGSLITDRYVLTAAHCITSNPSLQLYKVRLGAYNLTETKNCNASVTDSQAYVDPPIDYLIDHTLKHPQYDDRRFHNDVALVKVKKTIKFTDNIKPICLPFERELESRNLAKQKFTVSGWGKTRYKSNSQSKTLQFAEVTVWDQLDCAANIPVSAKPLTEKQLCANGPLKEDACLGDSGGPLISHSLDLDLELRYFQVGIVSFASTDRCGDPSLPTVYTRVDQYLTWVEDNLS